MDVSIIIINYKTLNLIIDCIQSIIKCVENISYEIIVVDNASNDNFESVLKEKFGNKIICLPLSSNLGFGLANNEGFKIAKGRNIFCLNPDTILLNNAVKILSDYLDQNPDVAICGGNLYDENLKPSHSFRRILPSIFWELNSLFSASLEKIKFSKNIFFNYENIPIPVGYITGADLMIKKNVFKDIKGFSSDFFMFYEETDLCYRVKKNNFKIMSVPDSKIQHLEGKSFGDNGISENRISFMEKGRLTYYRKNFSPIYNLIVNLIYFLFLTSRLLFCSKNSNRYLYYKKRKEMFFKML